MKKIYCILMLLLSCCLFSGCSNEKTAEYYDIRSESEPFYDVAKDVDGYFLGAQFYQEEPIQLWAVRTISETETADIFLYHMDGTRELLFEDLPVESFYSAHSYLDSNRNLYHFYNFSISPERSTNVLIKMDVSGTTLYRHENEGRIAINQICQQQNGRIFLKYSTDSSPEGAFAELDTETGLISNITSFVYDPTMHIGSGGEELLCLLGGEFAELTTENGKLTSIWSFHKTTYQIPQHMQLWDFILTERGEAQLLWGPFSSSTSGIFLQTLHQINAGEGKTPIVMRGTEFRGGDGAWFKAMASIFNQENEHYFIVLEECGLQEDPADYARQTSVEISAGKGPDIFYGDVLGEYAYGVASKGGFADLRPYMEDADIKEEDYFPCAFAYWRDGEKIYSITANICTIPKGGGYYMDSAVIGSTEEPDIETLIDALLSWKENAIYADRVKSSGVLELFLEGSENLWGMREWNEGTCDFSGELFAKILRTAKRYGYNPKNHLPSLTQTEFYFLYNYMDRATREEEGKVMAGTLFDDGYHVKPGSGYTLMINADSAQKEGAWEFLRFLLSNEAQARWDFVDSSIYPISKVTFHAMIEQEQTEGRVITDPSSGKVIRRKGLYDLTDSRAEELEEILEGARFLPVKTTPILEIIREEAQDYFDDIKSIEEITAVIDNRVQLYLDEIR